MHVPGAATPFVGREAELSVLAGALGRVSAGTGAAVVLEGEPGIGKTRLLDEALDAARALEVIRAACGELERDLPFAAIAAALDLRTSSEDPERRRLARLVRDTQAGPDRRFGIVDGVIDLLEARALDGPVAVVFDDLHRADPGTLLVLKRLLRGLDLVPIAVLGTVRPPPWPTEVADALGPVEVMRLEPLGREEARALGSRLLRREPGPRLAVAIDGCAGNPLYVSELIAALREDDRIRRVDDGAELVEGELPATLRLTVLSRLAFLRGDVLHVVRVAACLGRTFDVRDLSVGTGRGAAELHDLLGEPLSATVLVEEGARLAFRHDLVHEAVYQDIPTSLRAAMHHDLAEALREAGRPIGEVASHVLRSADEGDVASVELLRRAAGEALPLSAATSVSLLRHAAEIAPDGYPERDALALELAAALSQAGRQDEAESLAREVLGRRSDAALANRARDVLVHTLLVRDRAREAVVLLEEMAGAEGVPERDQPGLLARAARAWAHAGNTERALKAGLEAVRLADAAGDDSAAVQARLALVWAHLLTNEWIEALGLLAEAAEMAARGEVDPPSRADVAWLWLYIFGSAPAMRDGAHQRVHAELRAAEASGHLWVVPLLHEMLGFDHLRWGELDDAVLHAQAAVHASAELGSARFLAGAYATLGRAAVYQDDLPAAERWLRQAEERMPHEDLPFVSASRVRPGLAELHEARGEPGRAMEVLWDAFVVLRERDLLLLVSPYCQRLVRLLLEAGRGEDAGAVLAALDEMDEALAGSGVHAPWRSVLLHCRALVANDPDRALEAVEAHRTSRIAFFTLPMALEDAGRLLAAHGRAPEAIPLLEECLELWQWMGAPGHVARISARLRELGAHRGKRGARGRPRVGWASLTPAELRVAALVAEDLTYREIGERMFLSRRTVENHVARMFAKLGISARRDLAAEVRRRGLDRAVDGEDAALTPAPEL